MFPAGCEDPSTIRTERRVKGHIVKGLAQIFKGAQFFKGSDELARGRIPEFGAVICSCRENSSAVRTNGGVLDGILMDK